MQIFNRSRSFNVEILHDHVVRIRAVNTDTYHEFSITLDVDLDQQLIISAKAEMQRIPYKSCAKVAGIVEQAVGWNTDQGAGKKAREAFVGPQGCIQLLDLFTETLKALNQSQFPFMPASTKEEMITFIDSTMKGACYTHDLPLEEKLDSCLMLGEYFLERWGILKPS
ncbi:MAG: DUF2889 domain-containing protein [Bacillota bacterium]